jgi:hypothetical protein
MSTGALLAHADSRVKVEWPLQETMDSQGSASTNHVSRATSSASSWACRAAFAGSRSGCCTSAKPATAAAAGSPDGHRRIVAQLFA